MKKLFSLFSLTTLLTTSLLLSNEPTQTEAKKTPIAAESKAEESQATEVSAFDVTKMSEAFGHILWKNLETIGVNFDVAKVFKGFQDAVSGKDSPMSDVDCIQAITAAQELVFKQQCTENLKRAEGFLSNNSKTSGVVSLEEGKVQYKITSEGKGSAVESHFSPLIKYNGKHLDGSEFGSSKEEEAISLDEVIPGLRAGLLGMKEGEKRTVYIHPDLAYGTSGLLPPNSLLTFEIEVVKANAPLTSETPEAQSPSDQIHEIAESKTDVR